MSRIAIIGLGWYGAHLACELKKMGHEVVAYEANPRIFSSVSGNYGIRTHVGTHYPRSKETRRSCAEDLKPFLELYPELANTNRFSLYAHGKVDISGNPSKVDRQTFSKVCQEVPGQRVLSPKSWAILGLNGEELDHVSDMPEPTLVLGERLRAFFEDRLKSLDVDVRCSQKVVSCSKGHVTTEKDGSADYDVVINTTGFKSFYGESKKLPFDMKLIYQVCLALKYEYKGGLPYLNAKGKVASADMSEPFSFIVMDGWFPCLMPYDDRKNTRDPFKGYIGTHGKFTIAGSYTAPGDAYNRLSRISDDFMKFVVNPLYQKDISRFWPAFKGLFKYTGWSGEVLAKIKSDGEFRSASTFKDRVTGVIHVVPGKVINVISVMREVVSFLQGQNILSDDSFEYVSGGALHSARGELDAKITVRNTCDLNSFEELEMAAGGGPYDSSLSAIIEESPSSLSALDSLRLKAENTLKRHEPERGVDPSDLYLRAKQCMERMISIPKENHAEKARLFFLGLWLFLRGIGLSVKNLISPPIRPQTHFVSESTETALQADLGKNLSVST